MALGSESGAELDPHDRLEDALDEIEMLTSERDALRLRVAELEQDRLRLAEEQAWAGESELERRVAELMKENQELHVVLRNSDAETLLQRQEKQHLRQLDKCRVYSRSLEDLLAEERQVRRCALVFSSVRLLTLYTRSELRNLNGSSCSRSRRKRVCSRQRQSRRNSI